MASSPRSGTGTGTGTGTLQTAFLGSLLAPRLPTDLPIRPPKSAIIAEAKENIVLVQHEENRGKGAAIVTALDYCLMQDADLEYEVSDYPALLTPVLDGADVVYGSRFLAKSVPQDMKPANYIATRVLTSSANLLFRLSITDEATCFKVFRTDSLRSLNLKCTGFEFCPEVTAKLGDKNPLSRP